MKKSNLSISVVILMLAAMLSLTYCTKNDQVLDLNPENTANDTLFSTKVATGPAMNAIGGSAWDGTIDPAWEKASKLNVKCTVPDLGNNTFTGFIGNSTDVTMRSLYDATDLYMLVEWYSSQKNLKSAPWYFDSSTHRWKQEAGAPVLNSDGSTFRPPFIQDQFVAMFNIANSTLFFNTLSCYVACHVNSSYGGSTTPEGGVMYTNGPTEFLDCWRARMLQVANVNQANDTYIDWGDGVLNRNRVVSDVQLKTTDGGTNNRQSLAITGTNTKVNVPMWVNSTGTYNNGAVLASDTATGTYVYISAVDTNGVLSYKTTRGGAVIGTIDPNVGTDYKQIGAGDGPKSIPGSIVAPYTGSRGDITANAFWTGSGWRLLLKRALTTSDTANHDVDFSSLDDQPFGIGIMFNGADNQHAIRPNLTLKFNK